MAYWWYSGKSYACGAAIVWNLFGMADLINAVTQLALGTEPERASRGLAELRGQSVTTAGLRETDVFTGVVETDQLHAFRVRR